MKIIISEKDGLASFAGDEFFEEKEVPEMLKFAKGLGYIMDVEKTDSSFCDWLNPLRRQNIRAIDWTSPRTYRIIFKGIEGDKENNEIAEMLGCPDSGYAVKLKMDTILREYKKWRDLDNGKLCPKRMEELCNALAKKFTR